MSIWLFFIRTLMVAAVPLALRQGGAEDNRLLSAPATTVPPALIYAVAFREANLQEQINRAKQTLEEDERRLDHITAATTNVTNKLAQITATVAADQSLMTGTSSIITNLQTHYSRQLLETKYNATLARMTAGNLTLQNVSETFTGAKGKKTDTTDINKQVQALNETVTLKGADVAEVLDNFSKIEDVLSMNVSEFVKWTVERNTEDVFRNISNKFSNLVGANAKLMNAGKYCDIVPNITLCNKTNATTLLLRRQIVRRLLRPFKGSRILQRSGR